MDRCSHQEPRHEPHPARPQENRAEPAGDGNRNKRCRWKKLGLHGVAELSRAGYDQGLTFWDSTDQYGSHPHLREALKTVPHGKVTILTKTQASTGKEMKADLDRFSGELNTDCIDSLPMHNMEDANRPDQKKGSMAVGTSCRTIEALRTSSKHPWAEVDLARINPAHVAMDADKQTVISVLREFKAAHTGVIGMKIPGVGRLRNEAVVDCFTIGGESRTEMEDLLSKIPAASVRG